MSVIRGSTVLRYISFLILSWNLLLAVLSGRYSSLHIEFCSVSPVFLKCPAFPNNVLRTANSYSESAVIRVLM